MRYRAIALAVALACSPSFASEAPKDATENIVSLKVNGKSIQENAVVLQSPDGDVWLDKQMWIDLGLVLPEGQSGVISALALGVKANLDAATQTMDLVVLGKLLPDQNLGPQSKRVDKVDTQPKGVFINYDIAADYRQDGTYGVSVGHEAAMGVGSGTLITTGQLNVQDGEIGYVRGLTTWNKDFLKQGLTFQAGDVFTPRSNLANTVNLAGVRIASDRGLRQGESYYPVPLLGGIADTRSSAELYVNGRRTGQYAVKPGPYSIDQYSAKQGVNDVRLVVRDDFGREQIVNERFYNSQQNLRKGQTEFDASVGMMRMDQRADDYGTPALAGKIMHGVSDNWTVGATVQATKESRNATLHNRLTLGSAGALSVDLSQSTSPLGKGSASAVSYEYNTRGWSFRAGRSDFSENHWMLTDELQAGSAITSSSMKSITSVGVGISPIGAKWNIGVNAVAAEYHDGEKNQRINLAGRYRTQTNEFGLGVSYDATTKDKEISATWRHSFGPNMNMSHQVSAAPEIVVSSQLDGRSELRGKEVKWSAGATYAADTKATSAYGSAGADFAKGHLDVNARYDQSGSSIGGSWNGSMWIGEGGITTQRRSQGSFVVVEVPGQEGLPVSTGGGFESKTNKRGFAVVPNVQPLAEQTIKINSKDMALDIGIENTSKPVVAGRLGGAKVVFEVSTVSMREVEVSYQGKPVDPPAKITSSSEEVSIGMGGVAVLSSPKAGEELTIQLTDTLFCKATMPAKLGEFEETISLDCK